MADIIKLNEALSQMAKQKNLRQANKVIALDTNDDLVTFNATSIEDNVTKPVTVMRAIPPYPKKGMRYFFHDGFIRFRFPIKWLLDNKSQITIPNYGEWYLLSQNNSFMQRDEKKVKNGQKIDISEIGYTGKDNNGYIANSFAIVIALKVGYPAIVTILKDETLSIYESTFKIKRAEYVSFNTTSSWYGVEHGGIVGKRITYPTSLKVGDKIDNYKYSIYKKKGNFPPSKFRNDDHVRIEFKENRTFQKWVRVFKNFNVKNGARMLHLKITTYDYRDEKKMNKRRFKKQAFLPMEAYVYADGENYVIKKIVK